MITYKIYNSIKDIRIIWNNLINHNSNSTPYMYYYYNLCLYNYYKLYFIRGLYCPKFIVFYEGSNAIMIFPLLKKVCMNSWRLFGDSQGVGAIDAIYSSQLDLLLIEECMRMLKMITGTPLTFNRISYNSKLLKAICKFDSNSNIQLFEQVNISFKNDFEEYFKSLSKNTRQNIRTAYNRLTKDGIGIEYKVAQDKNEITKALEVYYNRQYSTYNVKTLGSIKLNKLLAKFKHDTISLTTSENKYIANLYIDGSIAACLFGLINIDNTTITVPRLAINAKYNRYSPGNLLIIECIKDLLINSDTIRNLDLSRGTEKYKLTMGGEIYYTYSFKL